MSENSAQVVAPEAAPPAAAPPTPAPAVVAAPAAPAPVRESAFMRWGKIATTIGAVLALFGTGGVLGITEKALTLWDQLFPHAYLEFAGFADNARALKLSIHNTGTDELLVRRVFFQPVDADLVSVLGLGNLTPMSFEGEKRVAVAEPKVPKGRHPVIVEIESIVPAESLRFFDRQARERFFADNGGKKLRIAAEVTRRGRTVTIHRDVTLKDIRPFIANRAAPLDVTEQ